LVFGRDQVVEESVTRARPALVDQPAEVLAQLGGGDIAPPHDLRSCRRDLQSAPKVGRPGLEVFAIVGRTAE